ncbi:hypothetical protein [Natronosalvus caseinilyticus]|uniref:hypothetical protein n=1 Tax=Natronosalvus caseinilyticus TaxID=2953747 RepID=UPI0028A742AC|nr:hypothetical protein [Natronosalvus caseinilyticus]
MRLNRRNVLVGLGTIVAGGGGALATGAFSTVEASRTVNVSTADDENALLRFKVDESYGGIIDNGGNVMQIDLQDLNENAVTSFDDVLTIGNAGSNDVEITINNHGTAEGVVFYTGSWNGSDSISAYGDDHTIIAGDTDLAGATNSELQLGIAINTNSDNPGDWGGAVSNLASVDITIKANSVSA